MIPTIQSIVSSQNDSKHRIHAIDNGISKDKGNTFQSVLDDCMSLKKTVNMRGIVIDRTPYIKTSLDEFISLSEVAKYE